MASPQLEKGYTRIANSLMKAICNSNFTAREVKILLCIIRYTYGFHEKSHQLSLSFIEKYTGIDRAHISRALRRLHECHVITISKGKGIIPQTISLQKDFEEWQCCQNGNSCQMSNSSVAESATVVLPSQQPINKNLKKNQRKIYTGCLPSWFEEVWKAYPNKKGKDAISQKCYKELEEAGAETLLKAIEGIKAFKEQNDWYHYPHGSSFFNGKWKDYVETEHNSEEAQTEDTGGKEWQ